MRKQNAAETAEFILWKIAVEYSGFYLVAYFSQKN